MEVKRSRLFEEVWSEPLTALAKKYKVSDVAVAKACRKHNIPLPGVGHWAKVAAGKVPPTPSLPGKRDDVISIGANAEREVLGNRRPIPSLKELLGVDDLQLCARDAPLEPFTRATLQQLKRSAGQGVAQSEGPEGLEVWVAPASIDRAVRLLNSLESALRQCSAPYVVPVAGIRRGASDRHPAHFSLKEHARLVETEPASTTRSGRFIPAQTRWEFDGTFVLTIHDYAERCRKTWTDGKRGPLETKLGAIVLGVLAVEEAMRAHTQYWEDFHRAREESARAAQEARRRAEEQARFVRGGVRESTRWRQAAALNAYLDVVEAELGEGAQPAPTAAWLRRARAVARALDPLPARLAALAKGRAE